MQQFISLIMVCSFLNSASAQPLFFDDFNYGSSAGSIISLSSGKWLENPTTSTVNIVQYDPNASLSFNSFTNLGGKLNILNTGQDITAGLSSAVTANNLYAAFLVNFSAAQTTGDYFFHFMPNTTTTTYVGRVFAKLNGSNINFGLMKNNGGAVPYASNSYNLNTTYCLVLKYAFNQDGSTNDIVTLYVFDTINGLPSTEPGTSELSISANTDATSLGAIGVRQGAATAGASASFDKIVVDTTWPNLFAVLPTTLQSFNAKSNKNGVELNWTSINEMNFNYYQLEKSISGSEFSTLAIIKAKSINGSATNYSFFDASMTAEKQYYRLKMVDKDGKSKYSQIVFINTRRAVDFAVYPNPVIDQMVVTHPIVKSKDVLNIYTINGRFIKTILLAEGTMQTTISGANLPKGSYTISHIREGVISGLSFIK